MSERLRPDLPMDSNFHLEDELKKLPNSPGVYLMHGPKDEIIYVGKAVNLKNRVRQYFQSPNGKTAKILKMISLIRRFEYIVVDSELEALVLENNLIKEYRPKYNTLLKDDKTYPYIKVSVDEEFPRVYSTRKAGKDKARYFGPYTSALAVKETIDLLHKLFKIRTCARNLPRDIGKERPCLYYHIGQCDAPCNNGITSEDYRKQINKTLEFLSGKYDEVRTYLQSKMNEASEALEFEKAIEYRNLLKAIDDISVRQKVSSVSSDDRDIIGIKKDEKDAVSQVFFIRDGRLIGREHFHLDVDEKDKIEEIVLSFLKQFYTGTPYIPKEIWIQSEIENRELLETWLTKIKGQRVKIIAPKKGQKEKLVEMAIQNAKIALDRDNDKLKKEERRTKGALSEIRELLGMEKLSRVESFDISNTNGYESVGSMVVFSDGLPKKNDYRKFKIRTVTGPDDYASMKEVLTRRFEHGLMEMKENRESSFTRFPDLIMMDGGKGQVNIAKEVLKELDINIPVTGMVKDDRHRTRGLYYNNEELPLDIHSEAFRLITRIQDETHRFAIEYHKSLRSKTATKSILDEIEGIGTTRRRALMKKFKSIEALKEASVEEIADLPEMNMKVAQNVYSFFHQH